MRYIDDLDGTDLGDKTNAISFAFEGKDYSIDPSGENAQALRDSVAPYIGAGHRVAGSKTKTARKAGIKATSGDTRAIRDRARTNGEDVSDRRRIPADLMEA